MLFLKPRLMRVSEQRGRAVQETQGTESVQMVAVQAGLDTVANLLDAHTGVAPGAAKKYLAHLLICSVILLIP